MNFSDREVILTSHQWLQNNHNIYLLTVLATWGSSPRPVGSIAAVRDDGLIVGSVSGGCVEETLVEQLLTNSTVCHFPYEVTFGLTQDERLRMDLPCGGQLTVFIERVERGSTFQPLVRAMQTRQVLQRRVARLTGEVFIANESEGKNPFFYDEEHITKTFTSPWRLLLIGAGSLSHLLSQFANTLGYEIIVCDPRDRYVKNWNIPSVIFTELMPDDAVREFCLDSYCGVVTLSHDPKLDDMALMEALKSPAFYVGALGSKNNSAKRRERLRMLDLSESEIARLYGPAGLPIGSKAPEEIALSIMAEITAEKNKIFTPLKNIEQPDRLTLPA
ncbi:MAG: XdhC family protein [Gammaproteobacteria bacterium]|nr:XdhC family protein [Gammaproteobacteria bacterium]